MPDGPHPSTEERAATSPGEDLARALADPAAAWPDVVLREHQVEALDELAGRLTHGQTRTWVDAPTGSGKTIMFLALAAALGGSTLILVPRRNLAEQSEGRVEITLDLDDQGAVRNGLGQLSARNLALRDQHEGGNVRRGRI